jgi:hypothetical protein
MTARDDTDVTGAHSAGLWARPVAMRKFVWMSFFTLGLYDVYWFYWNWRRQRDREDARVRAGWRTFLSPFVAFMLFDDVRNAARRRDIAVSWSPAILAACYLALLMGFVLPGWLWLLTLINFAPLIPVQNTINTMHASGAAAGDALAEPADSAFSVANVISMIAGLLVMLLLVCLSVLASNGVLDRWYQQLLLQAGALLQS